MVACIFTREKFYSRSTGLERRKQNRSMNELLSFQIELVLHFLFRSFVALKDITKRMLVTELSWYTMNNVWAHEDKDQHNVQYLLRTKARETEANIQKAIRFWPSSRIHWTILLYRPWHVDEKRDSVKSKYFGSMQTYVIKFSVSPVINSDDNLLFVQPIDEK